LARFGHNSVDPISAGCYSMKMSKTSKKSIGWSLEGQALVVLLILFAVVVAEGWNYSMKLRQTVASNAAVMSEDAGALIGVERLRNIAESQVSNSRAYFLLGSKSILDRQKSEKDKFASELITYEKKYSLVKVGEIVKRIQALEVQEGEIFDQAQGFRNKQTESKIVGQFYQSKTLPILDQLNQNFDEIVKLHNAELDHAGNRARQAGLEAQAQIPKGMSRFIAALTALFLAMTLLILRMIRRRSAHLRERDRLYEEAKNAVLARDEVIAAASQDFKEPLAAISEMSETLKKSQSSEEVSNQVELIKSTIVEIEGHISNIYDQKRADMGTLNLRLDQLAIADVLEDAQIMLKPLAKHRDVGLQFDSVNQSVLAFVDRERVMRVLSNLIGNAIKFSRKHSKVLIKVRSDQQFVTISIADSGPGIPDSQVAGLFDNFWQASRSADQGAGVGLAVVKTIIEAHGGTIKVDSNLGQGSTFTFSLPRRRPAGATLRKPPGSVRTQARVPETPPNV
jgi:signal transduction histidine kinase